MRIVMRIAAAILLLGVLFVPLRLYAATDILAGTCVQNPDATACQNRDQTTDNNDLFGSGGIIGKATSIVALLVGIASVIMIIVGGFKYVTASGDTANITSAKNTILYALVGLVVALMARAFVIFVINKL